MEDGESTGGNVYNKLVSQEDLNSDPHRLFSKQAKQQVSISMLRPESILNYYKRLTVSLIVLAAILLAVDIGLGVYYSRLTDVERTLRDINSEVTKLQAAYNVAVQRRDEAKRQLAEEVGKQQNVKWELLHEKSRSNEYTEQANKIQMEIAALKSHMPMIREGCRHCLPGWTFMNSLCYFFAFSDDLSRRSWQEGREFCTKQGADLAVIDTRAKLLAITNLISNYQDHTVGIGHSGFWIGLRDVDEEGTWKWTDGRRLTEGFWNDGEPNNVHNEDCAATYRRRNPFKAWNDAQCTHGLKWICEVLPRVAT